MGEDYPMSPNSYSGLAKSVEVPQSRLSNVLKSHRGGIISLEKSLEELAQKLTPVLRNSDGDKREKNTAPIRPFNLADTIEENSCLLDDIHQKVRDIIARLEL